MNVFVVAGIILSALMALASVARIGIVLFGPQTFRSSWGFQINVIYVVGFGTLGLWLTTLL